VQVSISVAVILMGYDRQEDARTVGMQIGNPTFEACKLVQLNNWCISSFLAPVLAKDEVIQHKDANMLLARTV
jgi:hypothetical protein